MTGFQIAEAVFGVMVLLLLGDISRDIKAMRSAVSGIANARNSN